MEFIWNLANGFIGLFSTKKPIISLHVTPIVQNLKKNHFFILFASIVHFLKFKPYILSIILHVHHICSYEKKKEIEKLTKKLWNFIDDSRKVSVFIRNIYPWFYLNLMRRFTGCSPQKNHNLTFGTIGTNTELKDNLRKSIYFWPI